MKKIIRILGIAITIVGLCSCGSNLEKDKIILFHVWKKKERHLLQST